MWQGTDEFDDYFLWLGSLVDVDWDRYSELLYILDNIEFRWSLSQDESRATEGLMLREEFASLDIVNNDWVAFIDEPCSVLEALIPLARRMNDLFTNENTGDTTRVWFWTFIEHLGLKPYTNDRLIQRLYTSDDYDIQTIVNRWLDRDFEPNGKGSIFPLSDAKGDQREVTLIYQMYNYVQENYLCD